MKLRNLFARYRRRPSIGVRSWDRRRLLKQLPFGVAAGALALRGLLPKGAWDEARTGPEVPDAYPSSAVALGYVLFCLGQIGVEPEPILFSLPAALRLGEASVPSTCSSARLYCAGA